MLRGFLATAAGAFVVLAFMSPLLHLWPVIAAGHWFSFPLLCLWFYGTIHAATKAVLAVIAH